jgi:pyridoxine/pyridoxamine 5'-phosphate oxidase
MGELQDVLDRSLAQASPFTRALFAEDAWDAAQVAKFINEQRNITIATVTAAGDPHAAVVIAACLDEQVHFTVADESLLHRCIQRRSAIAFSVCDSAHAVMGKGTAVTAGRSLDDPALVERLARATTIGSFTPPAWDGLIFRVALERVFAS